MKLKLSFFIKKTYTLQIIPHTFSLCGLYTAAAYSMHFIVCLRQIDPNCHQSKDDTVYRLNIRPKSVMASLFSGFVSSCPKKSSKEHESTQPRSEFLYLSIIGKPR